MLKSVTEVEAEGNGGATSYRCKPLTTMILQVEMLYVNCRRLPSREAKALGKKCSQRNEFQSRILDLLEKDEIIPVEQEEDAIDTMFCWHQLKE